VSATLHSGGYRGWRGPAGLMAQSVHHVGLPGRGRAAACAVGAVLLPGTAAAQASGALGTSGIVQLVLLAIALFLCWLLWRVWNHRRRQETSLLAEIHEREERLNLALWGSGDEFWDWNIPENSLYRLGAN